MARDMATPRRVAHLPGPIPAVAGIGLRYPHHAEFLENSPAAGWIEVHSENYLPAAPRAVLARLRRDHPVSLHGVGLSLGSAQGLDARHLARIAELADEIEPALVSEHLAWGQVNHSFLADLLPLPLTEESLSAVANNIDAMQNALGRAILIENPATYVQFTHSTIAEPEFIAALVARTGCGMICDINNIFVAATNHGWDPLRYLAELPRQAIGEFHLAGHFQPDAADPGFLLDTHDRAVAADVWELFDAALARIGPRPTLIERDADIPPLPELLAEAARADRHLERFQPDRVRPNPLHGFVGASNFISQPYSGLADVAPARAGRHADAA